MKKEIDKIKYLVKELEDCSHACGLWFQSYIHNTEDKMNRKGYEYTKKRAKSLLKNINNRLSKLEKAV